MSSKNGFNNKRTFATVLAVLLVLSMVLGVLAPFLGAVAYGAPVTAVYESTTAVQEEETAFYAKRPKEVINSNFEIKANIGFDNKYLVEKNVPFNFVVANNAEEFKGELQVKVYNNIGSEWERPRYSIYYVPLEIAANGAKEVSFNAYVPILTDFFTVSLVAEKEEIVFLKNFNITAKDPSSVWTGVLSETPQDLTYLKEIDKSFNSDNIYYNGVNYYDTINLDEKNFPTDIAVLNNFRIIVINNFNTSLLNDEQKIILNKWVNNGGLLVVGTGANAKKVTGGLGEIISVTGITEMTQVSATSIGTVLGQDLSQNKINVTSMQIEKAVPIVEEGQPIVSALTKGDGKIIFYNFDLGENAVSKISNITSFFKEIYVSAVPQIGEIEDNEYNNYNYSNSSMRDYALSDTPQNNDRVKIIFIAIVLYLLLVGPVTYFILKKRDKNEYAWVIIPAISVVVTVAIYALGAGSYYHKGHVNFGSEIVLQNGVTTAKADIFASVKTGEKGNINFTSDEEFTVKVDSFDGRAYRSYGNFYVENTKEICDLKINAESKNPNVTYYDAASWDSNSFMTSKTIEMGGALTADIYLENGVFKGTVTNTSNMDFYDLIFKIGNVYTKIGDCAAGATVEVNYTSSTEASVNTSGTYSLLLEELFGIKNNHMDGTDKVEYFEKYRRMEFLNRDYNGSENQYTLTDTQAVMSIKLYAFNKNELIEGNKYINNKDVNENWGNSYTMNVPVKFASSGNWEIPYGFILPNEVLNDLGDNIKNGDDYIYVYPSSNVNVTFLVPPVIGSFEIAWNTDEAGNLPEIFNLTTQSWEPLKEGSYTDCVNYVGTEGSIKLRVYSREDVELEIPKIALKGGQ